MKPALVISERDNVATALEPLEPGRSIDLAGRAVVMHELIPPGHKVALVDIREGQPVIKYGSAIGVATSDIARGTHVHTHNLASSRGRGDLGRPLAAADPGVRLAEPGDELRLLPADVAPLGGSRE